MTLFCMYLNAGTAQAGKNSGNIMASKNGILQFFEYEHQPTELIEMSKLFSDLADNIETKSPNSAEKSAGLRKLLEAKDCILRSIAQKKDSKCQ